MGFLFCNQNTLTNCAKDFSCAVTVVICRCMTKCFTFSCTAFTSLRIQAIRISKIMHMGCFVGHLYCPSTVTVVFCYDIMVILFSQIICWIKSKNYLAFSFYINTTKNIKITYCYVICCNNYSRSYFTHIKCNYSEFDYRIFYNYISSICIE